MLYFICICREYMNLFIWVYASMCANMGKTKVDTSVFFKTRSVSFNLELTELSGQITWPLTSKGSPVSNTLGLLIYAGTPSFVCAAGI